MGFGSYDESEQEQPGEHDDEKNGEAVTKVGESSDGSDTLEDESISDMMSHL